MGVERGDTARVVFEGADRTDAGGPVHVMKYTKSGGQAATLLAPGARNGDSDEKLGLLVRTPILVAFR